MQQFYKNNCQKFKLLHFERLIGSPIWFQFSIIKSVSNQKFQSSYYFITQIWSNLWRLLSKFIQFRSIFFLFND